MSPSASPSAKRRRPLLKGPLLPPQSQSKSQSYTQKPSSKKEVIISSGKEKGKEKPIPVIQFNSRATPQPFLDPSIIPKRMQEKDAMEKKRNLEESSRTR